MSFPIRPPATLAVLHAVLSEHWPTATMYQDGLEAQVVLSQVGSVRDYDVPHIFEARVLVECYGAGEVATEDLTADVYAVLSGLAAREVTDVAGGRWWVQGVEELSGPAEYPDPDRGLPRWQFVVGVRVCGTDPVVLS